MTALAVRSGSPGGLAGTGTLLRFALRRDRLLIPVWIAVNALMVLSMPGTLEGLYGTWSSSWRPTPRCARWSARSSATPWAP
jgi:putative exporter of polyketide antibiotics